MGARSHRVALFAVMIRSARGGQKAAEWLAALVRPLDAVLPHTALQELVFEDSNKRVHDVFERHCKNMGGRRRNPRVSRASFCTTR